ncbi:uncharacterized protein LOC130990461 [Salvia miltiorrhiza]|uniref:uncharacterized protein LOC130990461 n=1 Tax=Salvia miltiorrhiza TaxID=226208 RepID=UPI0025ACDE16|nr:uncharacterized protein LOC130990461 [Salvia miltiorrhiza]
MGRWVEGQWVWNLEWSRALLDREKKQADLLLSFINNFQINEGKLDCWRWKLSPEGLFTVKTAYKAIFNQGAPPTQSKNGVFSTIWNTPAMHKAKSTAWRIINGRIATCDNLLKRNVPIPNSEMLCVFCKTHNEDADHLFFSCQMSSEIWYNLFRWVGKQSALPSSAKAHFEVFINLGSKKEFGFLSGAWLCAVWCLWKQRNACRFNQVPWVKEKVITEIKTRLWGWQQIFSRSPPSRDFRFWFGAACVED